jgi:hypothetical protein
LVAPAWASLASVLVWTVQPEVLACNPSPPPPVCSKATAIIKAVPAVIILGPGGGVVPIPTLVFNGAAPPSCALPTSIKVTLTLTCFTAGGAPAPGGMGMVIVPTPSPGAPGLGANLITVPTTIFPGPIPRFCFVSGTAMTTWSDGMTTTAVGDTLVCLVPPSPTDPSKPRLDMQLLTPAIQNAHPGDQRPIAFKITNNDPVSSCTVLLTADSEQTSRLPVMGGVLPPPGSGKGVHAIADPGGGDNFPIAFKESLIGPCPCVPLPPNPAGTPIQMISKTITLGPGECSQVVYNIRSWPGCPNGSCGESRCKLDGTFSDGTPALACAGTALFVDTSVAPDFECPDSGNLGPVNPMPPNMLNMHELLPHAQDAIDVKLTVQELGLAPLPPYTTTFNSSLLWNERGRVTSDSHSPNGTGLVPVNQPFQGFEIVQIRSPLPGVQVQILNLSILPPAPALNGQYFSVEAHAHVTGLSPGGFPIDSFFDVFMQVSLDGVTNGLHHQGQITPLGAQILDPVNGVVQINFSGIFLPDPALPPGIVSIRVLLDAHGALTGVPCDPTTLPGITTADPVDGFRDVREDRGGGGTLEGLSFFDVFFDAPIVVEPWDILVTASVGNPPCIQSVTSSGTAVHVVLERPIRPGACTKFTFCNARPGANMVRYEFLPADVNLDGTSNTLDLLTWVQNVNAGAATLVRHDTNRDGFINTIDLLRLVQLLNGVNSQQAWSGVSLVPCAP